MYNTTMLNNSRMSMRNETVCVTGASGFIGSWVVRLLLQRGYHVRGTVQNLQKEAETEHLRRLDGAEQNLELFEADLLDLEALMCAVGGKCDGVFHIASPCSLEPSKDPQTELINPAVQGTLNVLKASHRAGVKRVVVTSSISSMFPNPPSTSVNESSWTDIEYCKERECWYPVSKVLAEKAAWAYAEESGLDVVVINPGCVLGYALQPALNASSAVLLNLLQGNPDAQELTFIGAVHVQDVARAHILLYETDNAKGRYLCTDEILRFSEFAEEVRGMYPQCNICRFKEDGQQLLRTAANPSKKLLDLGLSFTPREDAIQDAVRSLQHKGYLQGYSLD